MVSRGISRSKDGISCSKDGISWYLRYLAVSRVSNMVSHGISCGKLGFRVVQLVSRVLKMVSRVVKLVSRCIS